MTVADVICNSKRRILLPKLSKLPGMNSLISLKGEGTRIISMFKSIKPEVENDQTIKIHLSNAAQKDTFRAEL